MQTSVQTLAPAKAEPLATVPPLAWRPVGLIAGALAALLLATSWRYGYFGDELYFVSAGRHLAWGYADQPPLLPLLAHTMDLLVPRSVVAVRLPAIALTTAGVLVAAQLCREFGGRRYAQALTAAVYAVSPFFLVAAGHTLATHSVDAFLWTVICWLVVRWVRLQDDRLLLVAGVVTAIDLQAKLLIPVFWVAVVAAAALMGPRRLLGRSMLWAGGAIALLSLVPNLLWQAQNGWPESEMAAVVTGEVGGNRIEFPWFAAVWVAGPLGALLFGYGLWRLLRSERLRPYRFLAVAALLCFVVFWLSAGRPLYLGGLLALGWAAGAAGLQDREWLNRRRWVTVPAVAAALGLTLYGLPVGLPIAPLSWFSGRANVGAEVLNLEEVGWPELVDSVAQATTTLTPDQRRNAVIITQTYWQASAIEEYGTGLPTAYSASRGFWYFGGPPESAKTVVYVGGTETYLQAYFGDCHRIGRVDNGLQIYNPDQANPIWLCQQPLRPWSQEWPQMRHMTFR